MTTIESEKHTIDLMIGLYCRHKEGNKALCADCSDLMRYAHYRLEHCVYGGGKPTCRRCPIHCYRPDMKRRMQAVMCWAGPRMILYHPLIAVRHMLREL